MEKYRNPRATEGESIFIREINSGISNVRYQFFPLELLLHNYKCGGYVPCCVTVNTHDCKLNKICEMLLTIVAHNQHDVNDVI